MKVIVQSIESESFMYLICKFALDPSSHIPLTQAIEMDRSDIVKMLIAHPKIDPNVVVSYVTSINGDLYIHWYDGLGQ